MGPFDDISICLHADWRHCQTASARFADLHDVHWHQPPGAPRAMVHGYVDCAHVVRGEIPHKCDPMTTPHRLHVCVLKRCTIPMVWAELARQADEQRTCSFGHQPIGIRAVTPVRAGEL
jgi:hypothetical protein